MSVALYVLTTTFASSVFSAAVVVTAREFGVSAETMIRSCHAGNGSLSMKKTTDHIDK